jgi:hypothetical protein
MPATDPPRPWCGLPDELKVKILEYTLETNEAEEDDIINDRRSLFSISLLEPLLLTSKRMNELALETWGKSKLMIWVPSINMRMQYINPKFGRYVRNLSLSVSVPDHLVWHDPDLDTESVSGMLLPYELRGYRETPWRVLLSCKSDRQSPLSEWQAALPNLSELEVHLKIQNRRPGQTWPWRVMEGHTHKQDIEGFLAKASCNLCADRVSVRVHNTGFVDDNGDWSRVECPDGCNERLAVGVKALIEQNKL